MDDVPGAALNVVQLKPVAVACRHVTRHMVHLSGLGLADRDSGPDARGLALVRCGSAARVTLSGSALALQPSRPAGWPSTAAWPVTAVRTSMRRQDLLVRDWPDRH